MNESSRHSENADDTQSGFNQKTLRDFDKQGNLHDTAVCESKDRPWLFSAREFVASPEN
jgi:hypothetical protein